MASFSAFSGPSLSLGSHSGARVRRVWASISAKGARRGRRKTGGKGRGKKEQGEKWRGKHEARRKRQKTAAAEGKGRRAKEPRRKGGRGGAKTARGTGSAQKGEGKLLSRRRRSRGIVSAAAAADPPRTRAPSARAPAAPFLHPTISSASPMHHCYCPRAPRRRSALGAAKTDPRASTCSKSCGAAPSGS